MSLDANELFALLPAIYRTQDALAGGPLQALFQVIATQAGIVEDNIQQLYDDQFIETCSPWAIPYIGALNGYGSIYQTSASTDSRAEVANTLGYRRRKGTLVALEQVSTDVSGRGAMVVEQFKRLTTTESMRLVRPQHQATVDVRDSDALSRMGTAFDVEDYTVDVRSVGPRARQVTGADPTPLDIVLHGGGRFNVPDVAVHLWRWQESLSVANAPAFSIDSMRYKFNPLGIDMALFTNPTPPAESFSRLTTSADIIRPLNRAELVSVYGSAVVLTTDAGVVAANQVVPANLGDAPGGVWCEVPSGMIAVDVQLGRIQFASDLPAPSTLLVSYSYGVVAPFGGGPYDRSVSLAALEQEPTPFFAIVGSTDWPTLESAVRAWNELGPGARGTIVLPAFGSFAADLTGEAAIKLSAECSLWLVAGVPDPASGPTEVTWDNSRPVLFGDVEAMGTRVRTGGTGPGQLTLSGLLVSGQLLVSGVTSTVQVLDCTLVPGLQLASNGEPVSPGQPSIVVTAQGVTLTIERSITGPLNVDVSGNTCICASIVDGTSPTHIAYAGADSASAGADLSVQDSTIVGKVWAKTMVLASNTIFQARQAQYDSWAAAVWASRQQSGCVRFCAVPSGSITPRPYNCLPADPSSGALFDPSFVSLRYGHPAYALLSGDCPAAIWAGADNGSQLGVYLQAQETEAVANVSVRAPEYLPAQLQSGVFIHPSQPSSTNRPQGAPYGYGYGLPPCDDPGNLPGIGAGLL
jgi:hypothetical protein